jgi:hypothetical protein
MPDSSPGSAVTRFPQGKIPPSVKPAAAPEAGISAGTGRADTDAFTAMPGLKPGSLYKSCTSRWEQGFFRGQRLTSFQISGKMKDRLRRQLPKMRDMLKLSQVLFDDLEIY